MHASSAKGLTFRGFQRRLASFRNLHVVTTGRSLDNAIRKKYATRLLKIDGSLARNIDFEVGNIEVPKKTRRKTLILKLQSLKIGGCLARNARFDAPTCLISSLWLSCGLVVSIREAAKPLLLQGVKARCNVVSHGTHLHLHFAWQAQHFKRVALRAPHFTLHALHSTLHTLDFTLYTLHFAIYTLHFTLWTLHSTLYTVHPTLYTPHSTLYTLHFTVHTRHSTLYTLHSTLYTLHFTLYTLHSTLYTLRFALCTPHSTLYTPHSTLCTPPSSAFHSLQCSGTVAGEKCRLFKYLVSQKCSTWLHSGSWAASC